MQDTDTIVGYKLGRKEHPVAGAGPSVAELLEEMFTGLGRIRSSAGAGPLRRSSNLYRAAQEHANRWQAQVETGSAQDRAKAAFYTGEVDCLEFWGSINPAEYVDEIADDHKDTICNPDWVECGIGIGGSNRGLFFAIYIGKRSNAPNPEMPEQDPPEIALRDGLSYIVAE